ncbi:hypothetical protein LC607_12095 [Nostoc sp. CHAB 5824]|nr:hypothetical protein [Nostoc sp. CHAB 5824]
MGSIDTRILFVDDDADSRDLIAFILEQSGAIVTSVSRAEANIGPSIASVFRVKLKFPQKINF